MKGITTPWVWMMDTPKTVSFTRWKNGQHQHLGLRIADSLSAEARNKCFADICGALNTLGASGGKRDKDD